MWTSQRNIPPQNANMMENHVSGCHVRSEREQMTHLLSFYCFSGDIANHRLKKTLGRTDLRLSSFPASVGR